MNENLRLMRSDILDNHIYGWGEALDLAAAANEITALGPNYEAHARVCRPAILEKRGGRS